MVVKFLMPSYLHNITCPLQAKNSSYIYHINKNQTEMDRRATQKVHTSFKGGGLSYLKAIIDRKFKEQGKQVIPDNPVNIEGSTKVDVKQH